MSALEGRLRGALASAHAHSQYRVRRVVSGSHGVEVEVDGRRCANFCSNDYLGLAVDPRVAEAARDGLARYGTGSGASALVSGYNAEHRALEEDLARFTGRPRALLFGSGWAANLGVLRALLGREDALIADELNHASLIDGGRLSGARYLRVPHADVAGFECALRETAALPLRIVATDGVFSMDGDLAPLAALATLCREHDSALMVDDAHGFGVLGKTGRGALEESGVVPDIHVATLGKALGVAGAFVAGSQDLIEHLIQRARSWVFSTAPPPALAAAARRALAIAEAEPERRATLRANIRRLRDGAGALGIPLLPSTTPIQPLVLGSEGAALALSAELLRRGYWVAAIRPPTVPRGTSRLRITLSAAHTATQVDGLLDALAASLRALPRAA
ncbi:MAG TPA: 8-amino-7-oxononanoate synthase [Verrucomicrobiae bacterium]|nr:8-amino-7-oxononanoate synthase [Verrucomicrobiae bacterium]